MPAPTMMTLGLELEASAREAYCAANSTTAARATTTKEEVFINLFSPPTFLY